MIKLQLFGEGLGLPDPSPFVVKAMMLLKIARLKYESEPADVRKAPKHKLPVIVDDGVIVPDSTFIRFHIERKYGFDFDAGLSAEQKGVAWSVEKMLETHTYWAMVHERWAVDGNFAKGPATFFAGLPALIRPFITNIVRKSVTKDLHANGMGRHSRQEIAQLARHDIDAVAGILGERAFLTGAQISGADAMVFAFMWSAMCPVFDSPMRTHIESKTNIVAYVERMKKAYFP